MKLLIVEDDQDLLRSILRYFDSLAYRVDSAKNLAGAIEKISSNVYDCIVLDINLPDGNGLHVIEQVVKNQENCGVLILSANDNLDLKVQGLDLGADDYLTKPFNLSELNARIKSIVRRNKRSGKNVVEFDNIKVDFDANELYIDDNAIKLTRKEYEILVFLITNKNKIVTKQSILDYVWGEYVSQYDSSDIIYSHLKNLRKKMIQFGAKDYIQTVHGIGYKFSVH